MVHEPTPRAAGEAPDADPPLALDTDLAGSDPGAGVELLEAYVVRQAQNVIAWRRTGRPNTLVNASGVGVA